MRKVSDRVRFRLRTTPVRPVLMLIGLAFAAWQAIGAGSEEPGGLFSEVQAARGESIYQQHCSACHGARLQGSPAAPLTGAAFRSRWEDGRHTLDDLFYIVRSLMPNNAPGSLEQGAVRRRGSVHSEGERLSGGRGGAGSHRRGDEGSHAATALSAHLCPALSPDLTPPLSTSGEGGKVEIRKGSEWTWA